MRGERGTGYGLRRREIKRVRDSSLKTLKRNSHLSMLDEPTITDHVSLCGDREEREVPYLVQNLSPENIL